VPNTSDRSPTPAARPAVPSTTTMDRTQVLRRTPFTAEQFAELADSAEITETDRFALIENPHLPGDLQRLFAVSLLAGTGGGRFLANALASRDANLDAQAALHLSYIADPAVLETLAWNPAAPDDVRLLADLRCVLAGRPAPTGRVRLVLLALSGDPRQVSATPAPTVAPLDRAHTARRDPHTDEQFETFTADPELVVRVAVAVNPHLPAHLQQVIADRPWHVVRLALASRVDLSEQVAAQLAADKPPIRQALLANPDAPEAARVQAALLGGSAHPGAG
jgi:hypothetical protein